MAYSEGVFINGILPSTPIQVFDNCTMERKCEWKEESVCGNVTELRCEILAYTGTFVKQTEII